MKLFPENELVWSDVVANTRMNRKRSAVGVNSYEKELKLNPEAVDSYYIMRKPIQEN